MSAVPKVNEIMSRPAVRIVVFGQFTAPDGTNHGPGATVTLPGPQAAAFLMAGTGDLAPDQC